MRVQEWRRHGLGVPKRRALSREISPRAAMEVRELRFEFVELTLRVRHYNFPHAWIVRK